MMPLTKESYDSVLKSFYTLLEDLAVQYTHCNAFRDDYNILQSLRNILPMIPTLRQVRKNRAIANRVYNIFKLIEDFLDILPPSIIIFAIGQQEQRRNELSRAIEDCFKLPEEPELEVTTLMTKIEAQIEGFINEQDQIHLSIRHHLFAIKFLINNFDQHYFSPYTEILFFKYESVNKFELVSRWYTYKKIDTTNGFCGAYLEALLKAESWSVTRNEENFNESMDHIFQTGQELQCLLSIQGNSVARNMMYDTFMNICSVMIHQYFYLGPQRVFHFITLFISTLWSHYSQTHFDTILTQLRGFSGLMRVMNIPTITNLYLVNFSLDTLVGDLTCIQRSLDYFYGSEVDNHLANLKKYVMNFYTYAKRCDQSHEYEEIDRFKFVRFLPDDLGEENYPIWEEKFARMKSLEEFKKSLRGKRCTICLEFYKEDSVVSLLDKCTHVYCIDCAMKWLNTLNEIITERTKCPSCLSDVTSYIKSSSYNQIEAMIRNWRNAR